MRSAKRSSIWLWAVGWPGPKQNNPQPAEPDEDDWGDWEPGKRDEAEFCDWDDFEEDVDPQPEPGDFWHERDWDDDEYAARQSPGRTSRETIDDCA